MLLLNFFKIGVVLGDLFKARYDVWPMELLKLLLAPFKDSERKRGGTLGMVEFVCSLQDSLRLELNLL